MSTMQIIIAVIVYLFVFEVALSWERIPLNEERLWGPFKLQHKLWMKFSHYLGIVMSKIILTILWIVGFGPYAIIWKLMHLRNDYGKATTYWKDFSYKGYDMKYPF